MMTPSIVGLGYCGWDILCVLPRIPIDDKVKIIDTLEQGGGPSATAIYAAQKLGCPCAFIGAVGDDANGRKIIQAFQSIGVDTSNVIIRNNTDSPAAYCWIEQTNGHRSIAWTAGKVQPVNPEELNLDLIRNAKILHLDGHQTQAAIAAAKFAREHKVLVSLDAGTIVPGIDELMSLANIIIMSEKFAKAYTGMDNPVQAMKAIFQPGNTRFAGVTLGSEGSHGYDGTHHYVQPAFPVTVVDTTGAGDTYHGSFCQAIVNGLTWQQAMRQASMTSAIKCTKLGGRTGLPTAQQLADALKQAN